MKKLTKLLMIALSYTPIASVAVVAQAKASELEGEIQSIKFLQSIEGARFRILKPYHMSTTMDEARRRYSDITGLQGIALEQNLAYDLERLKLSGLIKFNERYIEGMGPSEHQ